MSNKVFQQKPGRQKGPPARAPIYPIQMLFKEPVEMPDKEKNDCRNGEHIGSTECFCYDKKMAGFALHRNILQSSRTENARCS